MLRQLVLAIKSNLAARVGHFAQQGSTPFLY
jgi:hypothetical protein